MDPKTFLVSGFLVRYSSQWTIVDTLSGRFPPLQSVQLDAAAGSDSIGPPQDGVFVVTAVTVSVPASSMGPQGDGIAFHVLAKVADISVPGAAP